VIKVFLQHQRQLLQEVLMKVTHGLMQLQDRFMFTMMATGLSLLQVLLEQLAQQV